VASLKGMIFLIQSTGLVNPFRILGFTLRRAWLDRPYRRAAASRQRAEPVTPGGMRSQVTLPNGASFRFERAELQIEFLAPDLARLSWTPGQPPVPYAQAKTDWPEVQTSLSQAFEGWRVSSPALQILVSQEGAVQFIDAHNLLLRDELPPVLQATAWTHQARLCSEECIFGLGEQAGPLNLRGTTRHIWNTDPGGSYHPNADPLYMPLPVYLGLHQDGCYLVFYENSFPATFSFAGDSTGDAQLVSCTFEKGMLRYYFIPGPPQQALERFTELTGRAELPPRWSLGYHQSRWGYRTAEDVRQVVAGFKEYRLPLDAIHLDIDYMDGYRVFTVNTGRFPDLKGLIRELEQQGIKVITILDPGVKQDPDYAIFRSGVEAGAFCKLPNGRLVSGIVWPGWSAYPDFTDPKARAWWAGQYPVLLDAGVSGIWHDMNEPTAFAAFGGQSPPLCGQHSLEGQGGDPQQAHNLYALQMNRAAHEALRRLRPDRRPWIVSRSGWVSQQRYAWNWTADTASSWETLRMTIATSLGLGLSGIPYTGPDIGGFSGDPPAELFLRWFQMAAFMPFFRTHAAISTNRREPWVYGEPTTSILREFMHLRQRLMPYLYTLAWQASRTGHPLLRPLFWADPSDRSLWHVEDAFLLGDALLIAPVLAAEQDQRELRLPTGHWYSLWDDTVYQGPATVTLPVKLERIPVLVRAGSVLPMADESILGLHIYSPDANTEPRLLQHWLYSDAGEGYGAHRIDRFQVANAALRQPAPDATAPGPAVEVRWQSEGDYPFPYQAVDLTLHGFSIPKTAGPPKIWINDLPVAVPDDQPVRTKPFQTLRIENS
jgi:alpha-glucosidase